MSKTKKIILVTALIAVCICSICFPVSALSANEGFVIKNTKLAWASSIVSSPNIISSSSDVIDGETNAAFVGFSGNDSAVNFYRPLVVQGVSGSTASSYTVNVKYYGVYFSTSNGYSSYSGNASAFVNGVRPSNFKNFKGFMLDNTAYGGEFTFQVNSNTNFTLVLYCGYNSTMASQHYFYCDITAYKNDGTQDIIDNQNSNTQAEIEADRENTQSIIDNQNQLAEQEKNEIQQSGDEATEGAENVPNQSDGFINALGNLVSALSYNGIECKWTLPQVKMPQISNIVPEMVLIEQQDIDFGVWVQKMPSNILSLIQAVCTGALIVYCFKELYGTISYVFTLKGGGE